MAKVIIISQARLGSNRFRNKILKKINGKTILQIHLERIKKSSFSDKLILATTFEKNIESVINLSKKIGVNYFQGSTSDVLDRFYQASKSSRPDYIVRLTSDCPLIDPELIDDIINFSLKNKKDYVSNTLIEAFPDGQDVEVIKWSAFEKAWEKAKSKFDREHVTPFIKNHSSFMGGQLFSSLNYSCENDFNHIRMTIDEELDLQAIRILINHLGYQKDWLTYTNFIKNNEQLFKNQQIIRNEGSKNKV